MSKRFDLADMIHRSVNKYPYRTDMEAWGRKEFWEQISKRGVGDCEDYVLEKRQQLMEAGVPPEDLRIAAVLLPNGAPHGVLVVRDGDVDWVADQTQPNLMTVGEMKQLGYKGQSLQQPGKFMWEKWEI